MKVCQEYGIELIGSKSSCCRRCWFFFLVEKPCGDANMYFWITGGLSEHTHTHNPLCSKNAKANIYLITSGFTAGRGAQSNTDCKCSTIVPNCVGGIKRISVQVKFSLPPH